MSGLGKFYIYFRLNNFREIIIKNKQNKFFNILVSKCKGISIASQLLLFRGNLNYCKAAEDLRPGQNYSAVERQVAEMEKQLLI